MFGKEIGEALALMREIRDLLKEVLNVLRAQGWRG